MEGGVFSPSFCPPNLFTLTSGLVLPREPHEENRTHNKSQERMSIQRKLFLIETITQNIDGSLTGYIG